MFRDFFPVQINARKAVFSALIFFVLACATGLALKIAGYFHTTAGIVKLEDNYEYEMTMLSRLMNKLALEGTTEYSSDGTLLGTEISEKDMEKMAQGCFFG